MASAFGAKPSMDEFARFCESLVLEDGRRRMELESFQREMLADYFAGVRETLILIPKKNGKTSLLAALALHHLLTTENPNVLVAASSRKQAMILFNQCRGFIHRTADLKHLRVLNGYREIRKPDPEEPDNPKKWVGIIDVLAADEDTADGAIPTLACVDELHRHKSTGLYAVLRDGLGARDGRMVTISTAGDDTGSPLGLLRAAAHAMPGFKRDEAHRHVRDDDFAFHEWALDEDEDRDDFEIVERANPASWQTVAELRRRHTASTKPWEHARFACGLWVAGEEAAISGKEWADCADPSVVIPGGQDNVYIGVDIGRRRDTTGVIAVWQPDDGGPARVEVIAIIQPPGDGTATSEDAIWEAFEEAAEKWPQGTFVIDPKLGGDIFAERLEREYPNARFAVFDQVPSDLARMANQLSDAIAEKRIVHPDDRVLNSHVLAAAAKQIGETWRFAKQKRKEMPIDGIIALAMAHSVMLGEANKPASTVHFA